MSSTLRPAGRGLSDRKALWIGILASIAFTALIWLFGGRLAGVPHLPDQGASWYYWQLIEPTFWSRATAWGFYVAHQLVLWGVVYYAGRRRRAFTPTLTRLNVFALGANALFIVLHFVQTHIWYDGLAQDVSIWSSQGSVILMLVMILLMENGRRGLFFGRRAPIGRRVIGAARRYHGYVFAWAAVYTFWYHPMEPTFGHLAGFLYMFLLFLQLSLVGTRVHVNPFWTTTLEVMVFFHGTTVAILQGNGLWPMFAFGFAGIFVVTQMYGLPIPRWGRWAIGLGYVAAALIVYSQRGWVQLNEIVRIPLIEYALVFVLAGLIAAGLWLAGRRRTGDEAPAGHPHGPTSEPSEG